MKKNLIGLMMCLLGLAGVFAIQTIIEMVWAFGKTFQLMIQYNTKDTSKVTKQMEKLIQDPELVLNFVMLTCVIAFVVYLAWYLKKYYDKEMCGAASFRNKSEKVVLVVVAAIGLQLLTAGTMNLIAFAEPKWLMDYADATQGLDLTGSIVKLGYIFLLAPITEELVFRGVTLGEAKKHFSFMVANLVQAVLFGIYHGNIVQGIVVLVVGFLFGLILEATGKIIYPILAHIVYNVVSILLGLLPTKVIMQVPTLVGMLIVGLIITVVLFRRMESKVVNSKKV